MIEKGKYGYKILKGNNVFVHSDMTKLITKSTFYDRYHILKKTIKKIIDGVGRNKTIIMPTFTYSYCDNNVFDIKKSKSKVGALTEYYRNMKGIMRTDHPIFSVAHNSLSDIHVSTDSFGEGSIFDYIYKNDYKIAFVNTSFHYCTFIHYIEQAYGVPYRYIKKFSGNTIKNGISKETECYFFVRKDGNEVDLSSFQMHLFNKKILEKYFFDNITITIGSAKEIFSEGIKLLDSNVYAFCKNGRKI